MTHASRIVPLLVAALWACGDRGPQAPLYSCSAADSSCNASHYTVVLRDSVSDPGGVTDRMAKDYGFTTTARWNASMKGFSGALDKGVIKKLRHDPRVAYIQQGDLARAYGVK